MRKDFLRKRGQSYSLMTPESRTICTVDKMEDVLRLKRELAELGRRFQGAIYHPTQRKQYHAVLSRNSLSDRVQFGFEPDISQGGGKIEPLPSDIDLKKWEQWLSKSISDGRTALMRIRDRRGYLLKGYATFEEYCQQRWQPDAVINTEWLEEEIKNAPPVERNAKKSVEPSLMSAEELAKAEKAIKAMLPRWEPHGAGHRLVLRTYRNREGKMRKWVGSTLNPEREKQALTSDSALHDAPDSMLLHLVNLSTTGYVSIGWSILEEIVIESDYFF